MRAAGADGVHLHVKDAEGVDTLDRHALAAVLAAVRGAAPDVPVGVTTGAWSVPDPARRLAAVRGWTVLPDFASVSWHEPGAEQVAATLLERGVGVGAGLWHAGAVDAWSRSPSRDRCVRVLLELADGLDQAATVAEAGRLLAMVQEGMDREGNAPTPMPVLLHGEGSSCWPALRNSAHRGLATRIGLEDVLELPDGSPAPTNVALIEAARTLLTTTQ